MVSAPFAVPDVSNKIAQTDWDTLAIDLGVSESSVAFPPEIDKLKSVTSKSPAPPVVSYTSSLKVTIKRLFAGLSMTELIVGFPCTMYAKNETRLSSIMILIIFDIFVIFTFIFSSILFKIQFELILSIKKIISS